MTQTLPEFETYSKAIGPASYQINLSTTQRITLKQVNHILEFFFMQPITVSEKLSEWLRMNAVSLVSHPATMSRSLPNGLEHDKSKTMKRWLKLIVLAACTLSTYSVYAEKAYIDDALQVGVRAEPGHQTPPIEVITTGTTLEVLEQNDKYARIRTEDGVEGWIRTRYLSKTPPAKIALNQITADHHAALSVIEDLKGQLEQNKTAKLALEQRNEILKKDIYNLHQQVASLGPQNNNQWIILIIIVILALSALSFTVGILWNKQQVAKKLGGHTL